MNIQFEIYKNGVENSAEIFYPNGKQSLYYHLTNGNYDCEISIEEAIEIDSWSELCTIGECFETDYITVICQEKS